MSRTKIPDCKTYYSLNFVNVSLAMANVNAHLPIYFMKGFGELQLSHLTKLTKVLYSKLCAQKIPLGKAKSSHAPKPSNVQGGVGQMDPHPPIGFSNLKFEAFKKIKMKLSVQSDNECIF